MPRASCSETKIRDKVESYINGVLGGTLTVSKYVRLAVERHVRDLKEGPDRGLYFDEPAAVRACQFFEEYLIHSKGEWAGQPFILAPWQAFILWCLFGWKNEDGTRRFQLAYNELARKNGKSTMAAGVGLYLLIADDEPGAEVYTAATKRDQAKIVHNEAIRMVKRSPHLRKYCKTFRNNINCERLDSKYEPLGANKDTLDGLNVHGAIIDELHAHKKRDVFDLIVTGTASRRQPLVFVITTAGYNEESICREQHDYVEMILEGVIEDDTHFAFIATIDEDDDWQDEEAWYKANPNLGVSVKLKGLREDAKKAARLPSFENTFKRLRLCIWTEQAERWLSLDTWDAGAGKLKLKTLQGRECYAGLDLSSKLDLTAFVLFFPDSGKVLPFFWLPGDDMKERVDRDKVPYDVWIKRGYIQETPGNVIDYDAIRKKINRLGKLYDIKEIAFDTWSATQVSLQLDGDGFTMVPFVQGYKSMSPACKELEKLVVSKKLIHGGNPVMRFMARSVVIDRDSADNIKINKAKSNTRVDGLVALAMAIGRASLHEDFRSVYETHGIATA